MKLIKLCLILTLLIISKITLGQTKDPADDNRKIRIPLIFHVIYNNQLINVPDSLLLNELRDLNLDFSANNDMSLLDQEFKNLIGNPNIEFYLFDTSFQETGLKGVRRVAEKNAKDRNSLLVNPSNCINVFIADQGNNASGIGVGKGNIANRVNLNYRDVGTHSHGLTHETGHWLGLFHIFGKIGNSYWWNLLLGDHDDLIGDTPSQKKGTAVCYEITLGCPCPPKKKKIYYKGHKTLYNNFMDYNPCRCIFTIKQAIQIRNDIIKNRNILFIQSKQ